MKHIDNVYYGVEIVRDDGSTFLSNSGGQGVMPALFKQISGAREHRRKLKAADFKTNPPRALHVTIADL